MSQQQQLTPLMQQYQQLKKQAPDSLLFFRMGDFYELFGEDAVLAANLLEITLTTRERGKENALPMAGVPHHSAAPYIQKLLKSGHKIAIAEQLEETETQSKIVKREIVQILSPAFQFESETHESFYLATAIQAMSEPKKPWILGLLEASTGDVLISEALSLTDLKIQIQQKNIKHFLELSPLPQEVTFNSVLKEILPSHYLSSEKAALIVQEHYGFENAKVFFPKQTATLQQMSLQVLGTLLHYTSQTQPGAKLGHLKVPLPFNSAGSLTLGPQTAQHLDLESLFKLLSRKGKGRAPLSHLGARRLKKWIFEPLSELTAIQARQQACSEMSFEKILFEPPSLSQPENSSGQPLADLEKILARVHLHLAKPKDTLLLAQTLMFLEPLNDQLKTFKSELLKGFQQTLQECIPHLMPLAREIIRIQRQDPPPTSKEGGIFNKGVSPELDELMSLSEESHLILMRYENAQRELTKIPSLKIKFNRSFGYSIEVTQSHLKNVPSHYQRKQTLTHGERFMTDELRELETKLLNASFLLKTKEALRFEELLQSIIEQSSWITKAAETFASLEVLHLFGSLWAKTGWNFPKLDQSFQLEIISGRHPLLEDLLGEKFIPNDIILSEKNSRVLLITGPNMGGKSTLMRQVALMVLLGQMGAPIPAESASWGIFSSIFSRIGAQDAILEGQSTFMVEMSEMAHILHYANERSLLILDEIGRGTSTYDGVSVAWAALEWICNRLQARTLFSTHYHELVPLEGQIPFLSNVHMSVEAQPEHLRFLYQLAEGPTEQSFGIHVAGLAGVPASVVKRAEEVLKKLEQKHQTQPLEELLALDLSKISPQKAHEILNHFQKSFKLAEAFSIPQKKKDVKKSAFSSFQLSL